MTDAATALEPGATPDLDADDLRTRWERWVNPIVFKDLLAYARGPSASGTRLILYALLGPAGPLWACAAAYAPKWLAVRVLVAGRAPAARPLLLVAIHVARSACGLALSDALAPP